MLWFSRLFYTWTSSCHLVMIMMIIEMMMMRLITKVDHLDVFLALPVLVPCMVTTPAVPDIWSSWWSYLKTTVMIKGGNFFPLSSQLFSSINPTLFWQPVAPCSCFSFALNSFSAPYETHLNEDWVGGGQTWQWLEWWHIELILRRIVQKVLHTYQTTIEATHIHVSLQFVILLERKNPFFFWQKYKLTKSQNMCFFGGLGWG